MKKIGITIIVGIILGLGIGFGGISVLASPKNAIIQTTTNTKLTGIITSIDAKSIILNKIPGSTITNFAFHNIPIPAYSSISVNGNKEYKISVNAKTGKIISSTDARFKNSDISATAPNGLISNIKAREIASTKVPNSKLVGLSLDFNNPIPEYDLIMQTSKDKFYISINAKTGTLITLTKIKI
ncbi:PepSY domain-containing protein [uncultured Clostridium sp.]|jgi:uncharacterized membrane protein YkoI|uniref:PepSY domain-containing protein n=1 Tax=uncultured Clostridium sp. TaxID=59620 RepID=UPI00261E816E|nr:PepSY domain-containing protein [uncultured Clostridium sp.]